VPFTIYVVGGAVRDELLGLPVRDKDYVVVGATPEEMVAAGFKPVGKDFPVFLHPKTHEEHALARTERKSGRGYKGFTVYAAPDVTLEQDLARRDLTINAIAKGPDGKLIDPFHGEKDLRAGVLKHVSPAFSEDPVRILRVARFAARFGFGIAHETMQLIKKMVADGETDYLVPERVWQEFSKGLCEKDPGRMFEVLTACGLMEKLLPEIKALPARYAGTLPVRFAVVCFSMLEPEIRTLCDRLKVPNGERELALTANRCKEFLHPSKPAEFLNLFKRADAYRRPERFRDFLEVARLSELEFDAGKIENALRAVQSVDAGAVSSQAKLPSEIPALLDKAREQAIEKM
jgi:tRNA nucleotidyltransferase (CCA-adding enzyme)